MPELTRVERDRFVELKAKAPHPSAVLWDAKVRTEGEQVEYTRLAERVAGEERLAVLRKQATHKPEEFDEMLALGAPADEVEDARRKQAAAEAAAEAAKVSRDADRGAASTSTAAHARSVAPTVSGGV